MAEPCRDWKMDVRRKLIDLFGKDAETLTRILWYLDGEDTAYNSFDDDGPIASAWKTMKRALNNDKAFKRYAEGLAEDIKKSENLARMAEPCYDWKMDVRRRLIDLFDKDAETLTRILWYLDEKGKVNNSYEDDGSIPPVWKTLKLIIHNDKVFKRYAKRMAEDTKKAGKEESFRATMNLVNQYMMEASEEVMPGSLVQKFDVARLADLSLIEESGFIELARAWVMIPSPTKAAIMHAIPKIISNKQLVSCEDKVVGLVTKAGGTIDIVHLADLQLMNDDAINNLHRWWTGKISGARCADNILDSAFTILAGVAGGVRGAAIGSQAGPIGTFFGGIIGGIASSAAMSLLRDRAILRLFGIPKEEALENAYQYLGVTETAYNYEINAAFRRLCLKHDLDKGGSVDEFLFLQLNMGTIKAARGQLI